MCYPFLTPLVIATQNQIRDWLTVLETMLKQQVAIVGDSDDVLQLLEKQKVCVASFFFLPVSFVVNVREDKREASLEGKGQKVGGFPLDFSRPLDFADCV